MTDTTYIPSSGLVGKWRRLSARLFECEPLKFETDRLVVSFTFDDFPKSAVEHGATELDRRGWRGTWYAASDFAGGNNHHGQLFEPSDITRLTEAGHEIACHTRSHLDVAASKVDTVEQEIAENRAALAAMGYAGDLPAFAYPYGETAPRAKRALSRQFETLRGVQPGINRSRTDRLGLHAGTVYPGVRRRVSERCARPDCHQCLSSAP
jgi:peptidoglycan/xylan/chitin deacetylase (PgdA/CDA1 family)